MDRTTAILSSTRFDESGREVVNFSLQERVTLRLSSDFAMLISSPVRLLSKGQQLWSLRAIALDRFDGDEALRIEQDSLATIWLCFSKGRSLSQRGLGQ